MAAVTNTFTTFAAIGNKEDLANVIYNISPVDCPFQDAIDDTKSKGTYHEWQTDSLATAASNAQIQGDDVSFAAATPTTRVGNHTQISRKECIVSGTQEAVDKAGRVSEMAYQLIKRGKELRRDMEVSLIVNGNSVPGAGSSGAAAKLRPLIGWYTAATSDRGTGGVAGSSVAAVTDGTQRALTEDLLLSGLSNVWDNGGDVDLIMAGKTNKRVISGFTASSTRFQDASKNMKLVNTVEIYVSDYGTHKVVANRFQRDREVHLLDTSLLALAYLRKPKTYDLAKSGDAEKAAIISEYTLEVRNNVGIGVIADLNT